MKYILLICVLGLYIFSACKKEKINYSSNHSDELIKLTGDTVVMIGSWNWISSDHTYGWCENKQWFEILTPVSENTTVQVEFLVEGIVRFYKDYKLIGEHRLVFRDFKTNSPTCQNSLGTRFFVYLDGHEENYFSACLFSDTLTASFFGFIFNAEPGCEGYENYFIRE